MVYSFSTFLMVWIYAEICFSNTGRANRFDDLASAVTTECSASNLTIHLLPTLVPTFDHTNFHLNNKTCKGHQFNDTHIIINTKLAECGTVIQTFNDSVIYINFVRGYYKEKSNHSESIPAKLQVKCEILKNFSGENISKSVSIQEVFMKLRPSVNVSLQPLLPVVTKNHSPGKPTAQPSLRTEVNLSVKPTVNTTPQLSVKKEKTSAIKKEEEQKLVRQQKRPVVQALSQRKEKQTVKSPAPAPLTFQARPSTIQSVKNGDRIRFIAQLSQTSQTLYYLAVDQCSVSLDEKGGNMRKISFIEDGCETKPALVNYIFQPGSLSQKFNIKVSVSSLENTKSLHVNCKFVLCSKKDLQSLCATGCRGSKKRFKVTEPPDAAIFLHVGPFAIEQNGPGILVMAIIGGASVCALLAAAVTLFIFFCKDQHSSNKRKDILLDNEDGLSDIETNTHGSCSEVFEESTLKYWETMAETQDDCIKLEGNKSILNMAWAIV